jgi:predicted neuraminidase
MVRAAWLIGILWSLAASACAGTGDFERETIFGPETPTGPYKHPACLTELANGDFYLVYFGGAGEYATDTAVFGARRRAGASSWSRPVPIARDPIRSVGNGVVWQAPDGLVWLFYVVRDGETWSTSRIQFKTSRDNAETWSDASMLALDAGMMVRSRPIVLSDGAYLLPAYHETGHDAERVGADSTSVFFRFDSPARRWSESGRVRSAGGNIQPAIATLDDGRLVAYCRRGGDYDPKTIGHIVRSESRDGGRSWSEGRDSAFPNPNAAVEFIRLANGHLLLVYNDSMTDRTPLTAALSTDQDQTYGARRNVAEGKDAFAYPIALQARDGTIHLVYTSHRRTVIEHAAFDEAWVREGRTVRAGAR